MSETPEHPPAPAAAPDLPPPSKPAALLLFVTGLAGVAAGIVGVFVLAGTHRRAEAQEINTRAAAAALGPRVRVHRVKLADGQRTVSLPGEVHAWAQTTLYAKVAGYLDSIKVDKGDRVTKGEIIAHVQSPEIDQSVASALGDLQLKKVTAKRDHELLEEKLMAQQDVDTADSQLKVSQAAYDTSKAMQQYEVLRAPFSGVVTNRYIDPGALLPAATSSTTGAQPIVDIADLDRLRLQVYLGQDDAALLKVGDPARVSMDQRPDVVVNARVSRITDSLDPRTRTMLAEIDLDNRKTGIYPGEFIHLQLVLRAKPYPVVPVEALIYREQKIYVASVLDHVAHFVAVQAGDDDGKKVLITSGLKGDEIVALNAASDIEDGSPVQPVDDAPAAPAPR